jgi:putative Mg2+ transporter-C (MgtC) family protein
VKLVGSNWHVLFGGAWGAIVLSLVALLSGALVGLERERADKPAGMRTMILIALGSALFTQVANAYEAPSRITAQVVSGIGFLGAGVILRGEHGLISGVTTAATIWTVAAIGVVAGAGYGGAALAASLTAFVILRFGRWAEERSRGLCRFAWTRLDFDPAGGKTRLKLDDVLDEAGVPDARRRYEGAVEGSSAEEATLRVLCCRRHHLHRELLVRLAAIGEVRAVRLDGQVPEDRP